MRMIESGGARKWPSSKDAPTFGSPLKNLTAEQLGLLLKECRINGDPTCTMPSRSGSAPPSIEGSFAAIENLFAQQNFRTSPSLESLNNGIENYEIEEQLRSDPVYFAYYWSNVNLNPQLPPPLPSRENQRLVHHISGFGNSRRSSLDDSSNKSSQFLRGSLSTHKEEAEDDRSPREASENVSVFLSGQASFLGRPKSLVDLIQEDFPRTPSPVYSQSRSSSHTTDEMIDHDAHAISSNVPSSNISKVPESNSGSSDVCGDAYAFENAARVISVDSPSTTTFTSSLQLDGVPILLKDELSIKPTGSESDTLINVQSSSARLDSRVRNKQGEQQAYGKNITQHHASSQQGNSYQAPLTSHAMNHSFGGMEKFPHSHPKFSFEGHSSFSTPTLNPPLYSPAGGYMTAGTSFYPNFQHSGLYSPQYSMGGYPFGSAYLPPFMTSYPSHGSIPMLYSTSSGPSLDGRTAGASSGQNVPHLGALLHVGKFYGQQGLMLQPPVLDPLHLQYVPYPYGDAYYTTVQHNRLPSSGASGSQIESFAARMESAVTAYADDKKLEPPTNGGFGIPSPGKLGIGGGTYYGGPPSMGMMTQFPVSPHTSPVLPSSPVGWRNNMRFPEVSSRNAGVYSGGHGQRGFNTFDDPKRHQFLEELKSNSGQKFELSDIVGRIVEFSVDQHGSRFIQQKLEHCSVEDKASVFKEVLPHASKLMTDVFGNYVIQKFFEHGTPEQRKELANKLSGQMVQLSMQMYGCRVIQKALEVIDVDQKALLVQELDGHVMRCVRDQNGNHVIQKCIECVAPEDIEFIISAFRGQVATLSTHPYGCRVIQRVLEHCPDEHQSQYIVNEILESAYLLAQNQYGNYVTQHVLERGKLQERSQIIDNLTGKFVEMSQHKYASNVVEKCLEHGDASQQELLIDEIIEQSEESLLAMMKDQFANYVIQKILEKCSDKQREILVNRIRAHLNALKKYTYGKHIVARFEQLCGEESQTLES